ncbi:proline dipeptidase [Petrotoga sp. HWH.PT.55.6.1]|uniref:M24 family metallopeptidase n=1 Tax=unclassified Petrotoga TaxID=2620614 RepID=UPI000CA0288A|nr:MULTISPECIES: aminopeptidase P family protein [unclassified Petrotoga]PNR94227.1 proline dipeptidase [Petrotoga sp. HWHPT.55.6.3]RPD36362.1 proline dipeptidase [Petrotoga sp. HWH.PT.55.6.1]
MRKDRIEKLLNKMAKNNIYQAIISSPPSLYYFLNEWFEPGERLLVLFVNTSGEVKLLVNELFPVNTVEEENLIKYSDSEDPLKILSSLIEKDKPIGIDGSWETRFLLGLMDIIKDLPLKQLSPIISELRMVKDVDEIALMRSSSLLNDSAMEKVIELVSEMLPEKYLAKAIKNIFEREGANGVSFEPIVGYGQNTANPHHMPTNAKLKDGDVVLLDMGCIKNYYCSDMTRTVFFGKPIETLKNIYHIVLEANLKAIEKIKPGLKASEIDATARNYIESKGYGKYFTHRTGHGVGIEIHEKPYISSNSEEILTPGMIFSIEPGIYLPGVGGVRIEDLVLVTDNGCEVLNRYPKDFLVI